MFPKNQQNLLKEKMYLVDVFNGLSTSNNSILFSQSIKH
jgi:hypothetical protein